MKFITVAAVIVAFVALASSTDAQCVCTSQYAGKHCGESCYMSGCKTGYIYQCDGTPGSIPHEYGRCRKGCIMEGLS
ncbi:hypothetical protein DFQ27_002373, partial [Actinomortierella ambigua]